jgi:glycosyltransferase involved in cell wall biosynthesis
MRVAYVIDSLESGGAQRQAVELAVALRAQGKIEPSFAVYRSEIFYADRLASSSIPVTILPKSGKLDPRFPHRLRQWLVANRIDLVHAYLHPPCLWSLLAVRSLPRSRRPALLCAERNSVVAESTSQRLLHSLIYRNADAVTVNAAPVAKLIENRCGVPASRIHYIPNGIDLEAWDRAMQLDPPTRLPAEHFNIGVIGRLAPQKNHLLLLRALRAIEPSKRSNWRVWFIGAESEGPGYPALVRDECHRLRLEDMIAILPPTTRIASIMRQLDVLVLPSTHEGFPNVVLEAMASRIPVIATRVGDVPALVEHERTGLTVEPENERALASALSKLHDTGHEHRHEMGQAARALVETRYSITSIASTHYQLYESISRSGKRASHRATPSPE